jgi:hypothetical protein
MVRSNEIRLAARRCDIGSIGLQFVISSSI